MRANLLLCLFAAVPLLSHAQEVTALNAQGVRAGALNLFEQGEYNTWTDGAVKYRELQRNETSIQLQTADKTKSYLIDFARKAIFPDLNGTTAPAPITAAARASAFTAAYVRFRLIPTTPPNVQPMFPGAPKPDGAADVVIYKEIVGGVPKVWKVSAFRGLYTPAIPGFSAAPGAVKYDLPLRAVIPNGAGLFIPRSADGTTAGYFNIDIYSRTCSVPGLSGFTCQLDDVRAVNGFDVGSFTVSMSANLVSPVTGQHMLNARNQLMHFTQIRPGKWQLDLPGRSGSVTWTETGRALDYIQLRPDSSPGDVYHFWMDHNLVQLYKNGASDSTYIPSDQLRVVSAQSQWPGQLLAAWQNPPPGVSPGFQIVNKTDYPVLVTLEQVGCLYYGVVQPGQVFQRDTGAVWFTIKAAMAPNIQPPTDWDCARDPALYAGSVLFAGATAGAGLGIPVMVFTALGLGASYGIEAAVLASGGTVTEGEAARRVIAFVTSTGVTVGYGMLQPRSAGLVEEMAKSAAWHVNRTYAAHVDAQLATQAQLDAINKDLVQEARVDGAYAGYPWPWEMEDRVMPRYDIVGGPRMRTLEDGTAVVLKQERPLTLVRVN
jgi:hypothetical protein